MNDTQAHDILEDALARATSDADFRQRLLDAPDAVLATEYGTDLPEGFTVRFVEKDPAIDAVFVLPDYDPAAAELNEAELEAVAGGATSCTDTCGFSCVSTCWDSSGDGDNSGGNDGTVKVPIV